MVDSKPFTQLISFKNMILCVVYVTRANVCLCVLCMRMLDECLMLIIINAATENFNTHGFFWIVCLCSILVVVGDAVAYIFFSLNLCAKR